MYADLGHISPVSVRTEPGTNRLLLTADPGRGWCGRAHCRAQQSCHRYALIAGNSSGFHQTSDPLSGWTVGAAATGATAAVGPGLIRRSTSAVSVAPRRARPNARRLSARARHDSLGCSHAPRPAIRRRPSTRTADDPLPPATSRSNSVCGPFFRQPMQVRSGRFPLVGVAATVIVLTFISAGPRNPCAAVAERAREGALLPAVRRGPIYSSPFGPFCPNPWPATVWQATWDGALKVLQFSFGAAASETMSIRQPVSLAARRAFWPSLPIARESW